LFNLTGKVVLVTGGNSGLGLGFASGIAKCGGDVVIWGRRPAENAAAATALRELGAGRVHTQEVDVSSEDQVVGGMAEAVRVMGRVDGLVQNAGMATGISFHQMTAAQYHELLATNQHGGFFVMREAVRHMVWRAEAGDPGGSILVCGSLTVFLGVEQVAHYGAAKAALGAMMRSIAVEYGPQGIRANMVCPGYIYTALYGGYPEDVLPMTAMIREKNPLRRWGYPEEFEGIAAYLMCDAARYHTGDVIVIDGGQSIISG
jgi:NAD(P)-dependent dehydrogenase (short-subunit alcohol dehydrogenase family)